METLHDLDPRAAVAANPLAAVGGAFVAGALAGWRAASNRRAAAAEVEPPRRGRLAALALSLGVMLAKRALREVAVHQLTRFAKERFAGRDGRHDRPGRHVGYDGYDRHDRADGHARA